jgi:hypothetical protein
MKTTPPEKPRGLVQRAFTPDEQQRLQIIDWIVVGLPYETIKKRLLEVFNIRLKSVCPIEHLWRVKGVPVMKWQKLRPDHASPLGWEITRRDAGRYQKPNAAHPDPEAPNSPASNDDRENGAQANPLDDQEKLDEVRRQVFGSAPNSKNPTPKPDSPKP